MLDLAPRTFNRYVEPFLGGGSLFFALQPSSAILSDLNSDLINAYEAVKTSPATVERWLDRLHVNHSDALYYRMRGKPGLHWMWRAVNFIYLNRTCWNGLYRVNRQGQFNVPIGTKDMVRYEEGLAAQSGALQAASLRCADFESIIDSACAEDFLYIDPPYTVRHNNNGFLKYNESIFSWGDQERLRDAVRRAISRGVYVIVSNAAHDSIADLYQGVGRLIPLERSSVLAASAQNRRREQEVMIKCY